MPNTQISANSSDNQSIRSRLVKARELRNQKIAAYFLLIFTFSIIALSIYKTSSTITQVGSFGQYDQKKIYSDEEMQGVGEEILKKTDTDKDGLTDWDELNVYHTSPYLVDTNADGVNDGDSIAKGISPLCPNGKCDVPVGVQSDLGATAATSSALKPNFSAEQIQQMNQLVNVYEAQKAIGTSTITPSSDTAGTGANAISDQDKKDLLSGKMNAATLRQMLISNGAKAELVQQISDADILANYQQLLKKQ